MNADPASFHHSESLPHGPTIRLRAIRPSDREQISDQEMVTMVQRLLRNEGWLSGSSTGVNVCGAVEMAHQLGPGHRIVTMLCDGGSKYRSRLFNSQWLKTKGLTRYQTSRH